MSIAGAEAARSEAASRAARARWVEREGNPVLTRSAQVVIARADELDEGTRAAIEAAITRDGDDAR